MNNSHRQMKEEEERRIAALDAFSLAEKRIQELNTKLIEADQDRKSTEAALLWAKTQAKSQLKQLRQAEDQLFATKEQIEILKKKLEEAEIAVEKAEQDGHDIEMAETEEALRLRSLGFVGPTASKCGTRPLTKLE